jgi:hypothetical protein
VRCAPAALNIIVIAVIILVSIIGVLVIIEIAIEFEIQVDRAGLIPWVAWRSALTASGAGGCACICIRLVEIGVGRALLFAR